VTGAFLAPSNNHLDGVNGSTLLAEAGLGSLVDSLDVVA